MKIQGSLEPLSMAFEAQSDAMNTADSVPSAEVDQDQKFGGFVEQHVDPEEHKRLPRALRVDQLAANVLQYREAVIRNGIAFN